MLREARENCGFESLVVQKSGKKHTKWQDYFQTLAFPLVSCTSTRVNRKQVKFGKKIGPQGRVKPT